MQRRHIASAAGMRTAAAMTATPPVAPAPVPRRVDDDNDARDYVARHDHDRDDLSSPSTLSSVFDDNYTRHNISGALDDVVMLDSDDASMFPSCTWRSLDDLCAAADIFEPGAYEQSLHGGGAAGGTGGAAAAGVGEDVLKEYVRFEMELYRYALDNDSRLGDGGRSGSAAGAAKKEVEEVEEGEDEAAAAATNAPWWRSEGTGRLDRCCGGAVQL
jgi:hypothetical protein